MVKIILVLIVMASVISRAYSVGTDVQDLQNNPVIREIIDKMTKLEINLLEQGRKMAEQDTKLAQQAAKISDQRLNIVQIQSDTVEKLLDDCKLEKRLTNLSYQLENIIDDVTGHHTDYQIKLDQNSDRIRHIESMVAENKNASKRVVAENRKLQDRINNLTINVTSNENHGNGKGDGTYIRWGKRSCPLDSEIVYQGFGGGPNFEQNLGSTIPVCLPDNPEYGQFRSGTQPSGYMYGSGYEAKDYFSPFGDRHHHVMPCVLCKTNNRPAVIMVPARRNCAGGWTREYHGYLMASKNDHASGSEYTCVDIDPDIIPGRSTGEHGILFYFVEGRCGSLNCPPYIEEKELTCVVCSL